MNRVFVFATDDPRENINSSVYRANQHWQTLPSGIKGSVSELFKDKIKTAL